MTFDPPGVVAVARTVGRAVSGGGSVDCPMCGCRVEIANPDEPVVECECCGMVWLVEERTHRLAQVLVGAEG